MTTLNQKNLSRVLSDLQEWNDGRGIDAETWVSAFGSMHDALLYSSLFWPDFMQVEGCLIWHSEDLSHFHEWLKSLNGDKTSVEKVMNHRHLTDFFLNSPQQPTNEQVEYFGFLLKQMWECKLKHDFPHLPVHVELYWQDREASDDAQITVFLKR